MEQKATHIRTSSSEAAANSSSEAALKSSMLEDNRPTSVAQLKLQEEIAARASNPPPIQRKRNNTGLPDNLKTGIEHLSGHSMDDVQVHYNSSKPAQLQAHAFAQGNQIHLAPGQEKHLPHEAWHVVQQKQGRVQPTKQLKSKVSINDDAGLEKEADVMGAKALQQGQPSVQRKVNGSSVREGVVQRVKDDKGLAHPDNMDAFVEKCLPLLEMDDLEAITHFLQEHINAQLLMLGVPPITKFVTQESGGGAQFTSNYWSMSVSMGGLLKAKAEGHLQAVHALASLIGSVYHEARHAEQTFFMTVRVIRTAGKAAAIKMGLLTGEALKAAEAAAGSDSEAASAGGASGSAVEASASAGTAHEAMAGREEFLDTMIAEEKEVDAIEGEVVRLNAERGRLQKAVVEAMHKCWGDARTLYDLLRPGVAIEAFSPEADAIFKAYEGLQTATFSYIDDVPAWKKAEGAFRAAYQRYIHLLAEHDAHRVGDAVRDKFLARVGAPPMPRDKAELLLAYQDIFYKNVTLFGGRIVPWLREHDLLEVEISGMEQAVVVEAKTTLARVLTGPMVTAHNQIDKISAVYTKALGQAMEAMREQVQPTELDEAPGGDA